MIAPSASKTMISRVALTLALLTLVLLLSATHLGAAPRDYVLQAEDSEVGFAWNFGKDEVRGQMPVARADLTLDFARVSNSTVDVAVDVLGAQAGFPFASQAMKGPKMLDAKNFPEILFVSTRVTKSATGALVAGNITVRGVTRPMTFAAEIFRQRGTEAGDLSQLIILLTGALNRSDFGATGWSDMAGDEVRLRILANIERVE